MTNPGIARLCLYVAPDELRMFQAVRKAVVGAYETLEVEVGGAFEPTKAAYDTFRGLYDAAYLIAQVPDQPEGGAGLWVVPVEIFAPGQPWVFGASAGKKALVSSYLLRSTRAVANVGAHEVGHMLGLPHCSNACLMRPCREIRQVERRTDQLCRDCLRDASLADPLLIPPA